jgi:hypothetical protein
MEPILGYVLVIWWVIFSFCVKCNNLKSTILFKSIPLFAAAIFITGDICNNMPIMKSTMVYFSIMAIFIGTTMKNTGNGIGFFVGSILFKIIPTILAMLNIGYIVKYIIS